MSAPGVAIAFDEPVLDTVSLAVVPVDSFSGKIVTNGVKVWIEGLFNRSIRNLSGQLVFVNLPDLPHYTVRVDASEAGYFSPPPVDFAPTDEADGKRVRVPLYRPADFAFEDATTIIRGVLTRGDERVVGARVWCEIPTNPLPSLRPAAQRQEEPLPFETRTGLRGSFALALRIPPDATEIPKDGAAPEPPKARKFGITLHFADGSDTRTLDVAITESKANVFQTPIDITGASKPELVDSLQPREMHS
jgi:hypothetical protein